MGGMCIEQKGQEVGIFLRLADVARIVVAVAVVVGAGGFVARNNMRAVDVVVHENTPSVFLCISIIPYIYINVKLQLEKNGMCCEFYITSFLEI